MRKSTRLVKKRSFGDSASDELMSSKRIRIQPESQGKDESADKFEPDPTDAEWLESAEPTRPKRQSHSSAKCNNGKERRPRKSSRGSISDSHSESHESTDLSCEVFSSPLKRQVVNLHHVTIEANLPGSYTSDDSKKLTNKLNTSDDNPSLVRRSKREKAARDYSNKKRNEDDESELVIQKIPIKRRRSSTNYIEPDVVEEEEPDQKHLKTDEETIEDDGEDESGGEEVEAYDCCRVCGGVGELICCDFCPATYHLSCSQPPLDRVPEGEWKCFICKVPNPSAKTEKILFWKFCVLHPTQEEIDQGANPNPYRVRRFLIKFFGTSYHNVCWVNEFWLKTHFHLLYVKYMNKYDMTEQPLLDDGYTEADDLLPDNDPNTLRIDNLETRLFCYGVKPEWLQVKRVIDERKVKDSSVPGGSVKEYLVKWCDLPYTQATWERTQTEYIKNLTDLSQHVEKYKSHLSEVKNRKRLMKQQSSHQEKCVPFKDQPDFVVKATKGEYKLKNYQLDSLNWLRYSWKNGTNTILADEMGLGKTIQAVTFLSSLFHENLTLGPFLVIAPLSTITNWEREFELWAPDLYVVTYCGNRENRNLIRRHEFISDPSDGFVSGRFSLKMMEHNLMFHVLLTSYEMISIDSKTLNPIEWSVAVVDEAHRLKNSNSRLFKTLECISFGYKLLLTGTPLQNNLEELYNLLSFLSPETFPDRGEFLSVFEDVTKEDQIKKMHELLGERMLRRQKKDVVKDLPVKNEVIICVELSALQKKYYKSIITKNGKALVSRNSASYPLLNIVMDLKKCCNHPYLFEAGSDDAPKLPDGRYEVKALTSVSEKLVILEKMLPKLHANKHRVLIFCQMTKMMDLLEDFLDGHSWNYERIDGSVASSARQESIDRFNAPNSEIFCFLLSTRAGGLGINLATADTVFLYDSDWNPHNDIQAFSRAHRIGQLNKVMIYRFVTRNSVEERILQKANKKIMLTHLVVRSGSENASSGISKKDLDNILRYGTETLFNEDLPDTKAIRYDDKDIDRLLDRNSGSSTVGHPEESYAEDFFSAFKIAHYRLEDEDQSVDVPLKDEEDSTTNDCVNNDPKFWSNLLNISENQIDEQTMFYLDESLGKGKRQKKQVYYHKFENYEADSQDPSGSDYNAEQEESDTALSSSSDVSDSENTSRISVSSSNHHISGERSEKTTDSNTNLSLSGAQNGKNDKNQRSSEENQDRNTSLVLRDICGFGIRARRSILGAFLRYGMPPKNFAQCVFKWCPSALTNKREAQFKEYVEKFISFHSNTSDISLTSVYGERFLFESLNKNVFYHIAIMKIIRTKVNQYACLNGFIIGLFPEEFDQNFNFNDIQGSTKAAGEKQRVLYPQTAEDLEKHNLTFKFNIQDRGHTELHVLWNAEELRKNENIWWRYHDFWILLGVVVHGYIRFQDILADPRFSLLNLPFSRMSIDYKQKFINRRFKLLEAALTQEHYILKTTANLEKPEQSKSESSVDIGSDECVEVCEEKALEKNMEKLQKIAFAGRFLVKDICADGCQSAIPELKIVLMCLDDILNLLRDSLMNSSNVPTMPPDVQSSGISKTSSESSHQDHHVSHHISVETSTDYERYNKSYHPTVHLIEQPPGHTYSPHPPHHHAPHNNFSASVRILAGGAPCSRSGSPVITLTPVPISTCNRNVTSDQSNPQSRLTTEGSVKPSLKEFNPQNTI